MLWGKSNILTPGFDIFPYNGIETRRWKNLVICQALLCTGVSGLGVIPPRKWGRHGKDSPALAKQTLAKVRALPGSWAVFAERFGTGHWRGRMASPSPPDKACVHK